MSNIKINNRKAGFANLHDFCPFAKKEDHGFIEVTKWTNNEGYDIVIDGKCRKEKFMLTNGEADALQKIIKQLNK